MNKRVLIVDDHPIICAAIKSTLQEQGYQVVAESSDGFDALTKLRTLEPEYMLLDIGIDSLDGLSVLQRIASEQIEVKTLIFTSHLASTYAVRCMQAGALGFISKSASLSELVKGLNAISDGYLYFPKEVISLYRDSEKDNDDPVRGLTNKEIIILQQLAKGFSNLEIASKLNLSNKTISGHKINILRKLGVRTTIELVSIAKELGLI
ncbi:response regulator transcription factor [Pseudomonas lactis]|uniref:DNA-binding response regulator, LuxR family n=1 Tax=Pseudomonas lactis TaxID=1615674 RepID=I4K7A8_9PSED|nr:response regulator transcription factor [Pseudomonas lactis]EIK60598.1 DNA-binding response regulator, LuxR family [Pseudomonas lactis]